MDTKTEMLLPRFCRTPGELHLGHLVYLAPPPAPSGHCSPVVHNVLSEWTAVPPKQPCSFKAKVSPHCASLLRCVILNFQMAVSVRRSISCYLHVSVHSLPSKAFGSPSRWWCKSPHYPDPSLPEDARA